METDLVQFYKEWHDHLKADTIPQLTTTFRYN